METKPLSILLVEDDPFSQKISRQLLSRFGNVSLAADISSANEIIKIRKFDVAFLDLRLDGELDGLELIKVSINQNIYPIVVSGESDKKIISQALKNGAKDYLLKPFTDHQLDSVIQRYWIGINLKESLNSIKKKFITKSSEQINELAKIPNLISSSKPIFIEGETGTGKRVIAHLIKEALGCQNFIEVNCSQFSGETAKSELFGHKAGSFTDAKTDKIGLLQKANKGILYLDEIHALSMDTQKLLLKAVEEGSFYPVGSSVPVHSEVRIISATCEDINTLVSKRLFRQDLLARISTFRIRALPLRTRREDIIPLFNHFISKKPFQIIIDEQCESILRSYDWSNNTREIEDLVENWSTHGVRLITPENLTIEMVDRSSKKKNVFTSDQLDLIKELGLKNFISLFKKEVTQEVVQNNGGSVVEASKCLRIGLTTAYEILG